MMKSETRNRGGRVLAVLVLTTVAAACAGVTGQTAMAPREGGAPMAAAPGRSAPAQMMTFEIRYTNLTRSQTFSPSVFVTHNASAPRLFQVGQPASFGLMRIAEEGNAGPLLSAVVAPQLGGPFGAAEDATSTLPGQTKTLRISTDAAHPMLSGAWMLVMTNDGFTGVDNVNLMEIRGEGRTMELMAYDAGTERNNERNPYLIARMGTERDPENGRVAPHPGIRGDADAPAEWKFDNPVARITIRRVE